MADGRSSVSGFISSFYHFKAALAERVPPCIVVQLLGLGVPEGLAFAVAVAGWWLLSALTPISLPGAITGSMNEHSDLVGLQAHLDDVLGFRIYGSVKQGSVSSSKTEIMGLRESEIDQLAKKGVEFQPANGKPVGSSGKKTYDAIRVRGGPWVKAGDEFMTEMARNPSFRKTMVFTKSSFWKSARSKAMSKVKSLFRYSNNPRVMADTPEETNRNVVQTSTNGTSGDVSTTASNLEGEDADAEQNHRKNAEDVAGELNEKVKEEKAVIEKGEIPEGAAANAHKGNAGLQFSREAIDIEDATKNLGSKVWGYMNALSALDSVCTIYQTTYTVNVVARTITLFNTIRFGITFVALLEKTLAGDDTDGSLNYVMGVLNTNDPETGQSFAESAYAGFLFNGVLLAEPLAASAVGGATTAVLSGALRSLHTTLGAPAGGDPRFGRAFLKNGCGLVQNLGVQLAATAASVALAVVSGGSSGAVQGASTATIKGAISVGFREIREQFVSKFSKEAIKKAVSEAKDKAIKEGIARYAARNSWNSIKSLNRSLSGWDKLGLLVAGVSTFGMGYLVSALSGSDVAGLLGNGVAAFDSMGTGREYRDYATGVASGGTVGTFEQVATYTPELQRQQENYAAEMRIDAKNNPLDITTKYSSLGSTLLAAQQTLGVSNSLNFRSTIAAALSLPVKTLQKTVGAEQAKGDDLTPENISEAVGDPFYTENKIATTVTGSPRVLFRKQFSFEEVIERLVDGSNPQIELEGLDQETGEPILSIIGGSELEKYADQCHNPERLELDPNYAADDGEENIYDINTCVPGGSKYDAEKYPLYADAIRYIYQASPSDSGQNLSDTAPSSSSPGATSLPSGSTQELAKQIMTLVDSGKIKCNGHNIDGCPDIKRNAQGQSARQRNPNSSGSVTPGVRGCAVDSIDNRILGIILNLGKKYSLTISSLCWNRSATKSNDNHVFGRGVDFSIIDGQVVGGGGWSKADALLLDTTTFMPPSQDKLWFGQYQCSRTSVFQQVKNKGYAGGTDSCNHQHISVYGSAE